EVSVAGPHLLRTEAVVLRRHDLGEADRIITLFTAHFGKLRAVAKGVRRPTSKLGGHLELFTRSQILLARGRNLDIITQVETIESFLGLREDLWRAGQAYYAAELLDRLTEDHAENQALFALLVATLDRVANARRPDQAVRLFEVQALDLLGYRPEITRCVKCREPLEPDRTSFSVSDGGALCHACRSSSPSSRVLSPNALKVLRRYQSGDWPTVSRLRLGDELGEELERLLRDYTQYVAETQLKSAAFVTMLRQQGIVTASASLDRHP
ncbi:MAG: DNA repair protein RecO, partial [Chloroflexota bacterium]